MRPQSSAMPPEDRAVNPDREIFFAARNFFPFAQIALRAWAE
jgi:hypothetical protein